MNKYTMNFLSISVIIYVLIAIAFPIYVSADRVTETIKECTATLEDDFSDNEVLIAVMPFANFTQYDENSFSDIDCIEVKELTRNVEENELCRIIKLTIEGHSKQKVLDAIDILHQRTDVYIAEPNYYGKPLGNDSNTMPMTISEVSDITTDTMASQWALDKIDLQNALLKPVAQHDTIKIGVIDTGIDATHYALRDYDLYILSWTKQTYCFLFLDLF